MSGYEQATVCDFHEPCISCGSEWMSEHQYRMSAGCAQRPPECLAARQAFEDCGAERSGLSIVAILSRDDSCQVDLGSSGELDPGLYDVAHPANYLISTPPTFPGWRLRAQPGKNTKRKHHAAWPHQF